ncbi:hypothetical protein PS1_019771 [Malus domestica]
MAIAAVVTATMALAARPASNLFLTPHKTRWVFTPFAAAFLLSGPDSLHDVDLQVRDITSNPEWERAYQYEIPVLARVLSDGTENPGNFPS